MSPPIDIAPSPEPGAGVPRDEAPLPRTQRRGIGLCLSGGGFRATLFHAGALRRLNELGLVSHPELRTIASVSGGSITAARLATALTRLTMRPGEPIAGDDW